jgi:hypothetical protein
MFNVFFCVGVMYSGEYDACDITLNKQLLEKKRKI